MNESKYDNLKEAIGKSKLQHDIMIWGATEKSDEMVSLFTAWGFTVSGYIDRDYINIKEYKGYRVHGAEQLNKRKYFVYVALKANHKEVIDTLELFGYQEFEDYWYPRRLVDLDGTQNYQDPYGNSLITENSNPIQLLLRDGGKVKIKTKYLNETVKITSEGCASITIGERVSFGGKTVVSSTNGTIMIHDHCKFREFIAFRTSSGGEIHIGEDCSIQTYAHFVASFGAKIVLGQDCMVSYMVLIRAGNSHNMIDLNTLEHLDDNSNRDVIIGKHVWIRMRATIMNGVEIGSGSTVGANSFICKKKFPTNCCLAGNPAKILRERTAWIRDGVVMHKDIEDYLDFIYDEEDL